MQSIASLKSVYSRTILKYICLSTFSDLERQGYFKFDFIMLSQFRGIPDNFHRNSDKLSFSDEKFFYLKEPSPNWEREPLKMEGEGIL